ncbi:MAG: hypothetical protein P4L41_08290 [Flavipsychrobacter sp.]|nr:hypothetical protein [Flavipsychrobacter sp.]
MERVSITHYNSVNSVWLQMLGFYRLEMRALKIKLTDILRKNTNTDVVGQARQYEIVFDVQLGTIDELCNDICVATTEQAVHTKEGYIDINLWSAYNKLKDRFILEERKLNEVKKSFKQFASAMDANSNNISHSYLSN